eukprot:TRINITY_DN2368_c0_g2_i2.p3 TRINITY_DN2368_c0_g2~~TRINITY_DN2368_c0_g2_i2.p3  ORF type:complete len:206 (-),score=49.44 TRINITY_DN2368_c0_g2_i2:40-657(-)
MYKGKVKCERYQSLMAFECEFGHEWSLKYCKYVFTKWCPACAKKEKEEKKRMCDELERERREKFAAEQEKIFEEAKKKMEEQEALRGNRTTLFDEASPVSYQTIYDGVRLTDDSMQVIAQEQATKYLTSNNAPLGLNIEDVCLIYKTLMISPTDLLRKMQQIPKINLGSIYRKYAVRLHPDKNNHPQANVAFQKLTECYKSCASS